VQCEVFEEFLCETINTMVILGPKEVKGFLQEPLEKVLQKDRPEDDMAVSRHPSDSRPVHSITVSVGNGTVKVVFDQILSFFWGTQLDGVCCHCLRAFTGGEPPIRTFAKHEQSPTEDNICVRIFNRHLCCLKETEGIFRSSVSCVGRFHSQSECVRIARR
jgi:hypothetical protein